MKMNKEEIDEIDKLEIDFNDIDELNLALEVSSKKAIYLLDELCENVIKLQQENKQLKERIKEFENFVFEIYKDNYRCTKNIYLNELLCNYYDDMDYASDFKLHEILEGDNNE